MNELLTCDRIEFTEGNNEFKLRIKAKKRWFPILFISSWMVGWCYGFCFAVKTIFIDDVHFLFKLFVSIWLVFWVFGGIKVLRILLWYFKGVEQISVIDGDFFLCKTTFGRGKQQAYEIGEIKNLSLSEIHPKYFSWIIQQVDIAPMNKRSGKLSFKYKGKPVTFANEIDLIQSEQLLDFLKQHSSFEDGNFK